MSDDSDFEFSDDEELMAKRRAELMQQQTAPVQEEEQTDDAIFRSHFDKNHPNYHGGLQTAVPLFGQRVPDSMKDHANWRELPEVEQTTTSPDEFGSVYEKLYYEREGVNSLKKAVANVLPLVAAVVQNKATLANAPEDRRAKAQELLDKSEALRASQCEALKVVVDREVEKQSEYVADLQDLYTRAAVPDVTAEQHQQLLERSKRFTQRVFGVQNKLLQEMKKAKQEYLKNKM